MTQSAETTYQVVISDEGRYSIWPTYKQIPWGWLATGTTGNKQVCLDHIAEVWADMRPLSLQRAMSAQTSEQISKQSESQLI
ncbi:MbtH family NRPS accessory protein [cf. Phormidesmis sp. LEGE 11477]|uniref:MbtH family protein n=1 Tax=cf. Phormidesmis sp. LEGE 11477 TaxID=1828680 RepID=UPI0018820DE4|nr:MbtH family NRPS accessory protein [cf. Phormidesmis sp. LEGE 11477]MBE9060577.1 MbtH family NRPS accessory protein [cf. Phormidesmis sp. LEGE 11477]